MIDDLKPFEAVQRVQLPPGKGAARQPEASLAWLSATGVVKRRQRVMKRRGKPRNHVRDDAFGVLGPGAAPDLPSVARQAGSSGVLGRRKVTGWIAGELERSRPRPCGARRKSERRLIQRLPAR